MKNTVNHIYNLWLEERIDAYNHVQTQMNKPLLQNF